jgi:hypothetical protein
MIIGRQESINQHHAYAPDVRLSMKRRSSGQEAYRQENFVNPVTKLRRGTIRRTHVRWATRIRIHPYQANFLLRVYSDGTA